MRSCPRAFFSILQALKSGQGIILDLDFQDLMTEQETRSLVGQLQFAYAANCKAEVPAHLYFTSFNVSAAASSLPIHMCGSLLSGRHVNMPAGVGKLGWQASASYTLLFLNCPFSEHAALHDRLKGGCCRGQHCMLGVQLDCYRPACAS